MEPVLLSRVNAQRARRRQVASERQRDGAAQAEAFRASAPRQVVAVGQGVPNENGLPVANGGARGSLAQLVVTPGNLERVQVSGCAGRGGRAHAFRGVVLRETDPGEGMASSPDQN